MKPLVTVICTTYNQEKYIKQALDGFVMQKTDFAVEVLIHDDASTDKTTDIIQDYTKKHSNMLKPIFGTKNRYSKGDYSFINEMFRSAKGKYIAYCEGDDYWTDPKKLQIQVDFLESHPDHALCFHPVRVFFEEKEEPDEVYPEKKYKNRFRVRELIKWNFIQTNSVMYRKQDYSYLADNVLPGDWYLHLYHAQFGEIGFIERIMAAYRRHKGGVWWSSYSNKRELWEKHGLPHLNFYNEVLKLYGGKPEYRRIIYSCIFEILGVFIDIGTKKAQKLIEKAMKLYSETFGLFLIEQHSLLSSKEAAINSLNEEKAVLEREINMLGGELAEKNHLIHQCQDEIKAVKSSRFWRLRNIVARLVGKDVI